MIVLWAETNIDALCGLKNTKNMCSTKVRGLGEQGNMIIYFNGTRYIFGINSREQGISLLLKGTLTTKSWGK